MPKLTWEFLNKSTLSKNLPQYFSHKSAWRYHNSIDNIPMRLFIRFAFMLYDGTNIIKAAANGIVERFEFHRISRYTAFYLITKLKFRFGLNFKKIYDCKFRIISRTIYYYTYDEDANIFKWIMDMECNKPCRVLDSKKMNFIFDNI